MAVREPEAKLMSDRRDVNGGEVFALYARRTALTPEPKGGMLCRLMN